MNSTHAVRALSIATLALALIFLGHGPDRADSIRLLLGYAAAFGAYLIVVWRGGLQWKQIVYVAIALRVALLFAPITWTDDHYRYMWDGLCTIHGISPFTATPSQLLDAFPQVFTRTHFELLNSPTYHSVYPPVAQGFFAFATWCGSGDLWRSTVALRVIMIAFDIAAISILAHMLQKASMDVRSLALYALNPLVILELSVNIHLEALIIPSMLLFILFMSREWIKAAGGMVAWAAAVKLWPLVFLACIPVRFGPKRSILAIAAAVVLFLISWLPFATPDLVPNVFSSIGLFTNKLEFNGALFEGLRILLGDALVKGTGLLPVITIVALLALLIHQWMRRTMTLPELMLWLIAIHLFGSQAVHPWYILPLLALASLTGHRWPYLWSLLIVPTYLTYGSEPYEQPYIWIAVEYTVLFAFILYESKTRKTRVAMA